MVEILKLIYDRPAILCAKKLTGVHSNTRMSDERLTTACNFVAIKAVRLVGL